MRDKVVLVNEADESLGEMEKIEAHKKNKLHRAFSVFVFSKNKNNNKWQLLLQKRALNKYHCGGLWTNTCCSHPQPGESVLDAGLSRLQEELGLEGVDLQDAGSFIYQADFSNGLSEHEFDHVLVGVCDEDIKFQINPDEVCDWRWCDIDDLNAWLDEGGDVGLNHSLTPWLRPALRLALDFLD